MTVIIKRIILTFLTILWMCLIFAYSARNSDQSTRQSHMVGRMFGHIVYADFETWRESDQGEFAEKWDYPIRKLAHFTEYAVLGVLLIETLSAWSLPVKKAIVYGIAIGIAYAISDEIHQYFVPGRACQIRDMIIDSVGVMSGIFAYIIFSKVFKGKK